MYCYNPFVLSQHSCIVVDSKIVLLWLHFIISLLLFVYPLLLYKLFLKNECVNACVCVCVRVCSCVSVCACVRVCVTGCVFV